MPMRVGICDDDSAQAGYLRRLVDGWAKAGGFPVDIRMFGSAEAFWFAYEEDKLWDLLLLDIQMKAMDGVALAQRIRLGNQAVQIVFVTGYADYMAEGYEVSALHYLLKPVREDKLSAVLNRARANLGLKEKAIVLAIGGESVRILTDSIQYVEAFAHTVSIRTAQGNLEAKTAISDMERLLQTDFVRCHRSYIVGLKHVKRITRTSVVLDNGQELPLSRSSYDKTNQAFIAYYRRTEQ